VSTNAILTSSRFPGTPAKGCRKCPRLVAFRHTNRKANPNWENAAIPPWGSTDAQLLILGLAPGLKGANRTGRIFTGDSAGHFLFHYLGKAGLVNGEYNNDAEDTLTSKKIAITNAVACVPPQNKPTATETNNCLPFLRQQIKGLPNLKAIFCLGGLAHKAAIRSLDLRQRDYPFSHGAVHTIPQQGTNLRNLAIFDSYHCSRYNTQTRRLTGDMFFEVLQAVKSYIGH